MKNRSVKTVISIFLILTFILSCLVACGREEPAETSAGSSATTWTSQAGEADTEGAEPPSLSDPVSVSESSGEPVASDGPAEPMASSTVRLLVIETTDIHGNIIEASSGNEDTFQYRLAYIAHAVNEARASGEYDDVILLDGGDLYQGPPVSDLLYGDSVKAAIDAMDYDAVCLGNHEFDWDVTVTCADSDGTVAAYELDEYSGDPDIPVVAANIYDAATGLRVPFTKDYVILEKAGKRIAVIGYLEDYSGSIKAEKIVPYRIDENLGRFNDLVKEINEKEDPDMTVVLAHSDPEHIARLLDKEQVDLVMGGHTHEISAGVAENGIPFMQGCSKAQGYASAVAVIAADGTANIEDVMYTSITDDKTVLYDTEENLEHLDKTVLDISYAAWNKVWEEMSEVVGYIDTPASKDKKNGVCTAANFITSVTLRAASENGAIAAFWNYGGIRTSFKIPSGEYTRQITMYDIYSMIPFGNTMLLYDITGPELARQLELALADSSYGDFVSGITYTYTAEGDDFTVLGITLDDGTEIDLQDEETLWRVCISDYCSTVEGSIFEGKTPVIPPADSPIDHDLVIEQLRKERDDGDGYIPIDKEARGILIEE